MTQSFHFSLKKSSSLIIRSCYLLPRRPRGSYWGRGKFERARKKFGRREETRGRALGDKVVTMDFYLTKYFKPMDVTSGSVGGNLVTTTCRDKVTLQLSNIAN